MFIRERVVNARETVDAVASGYDDVLSSGLRRFQTDVGRVKLGSGRLFNMLVLAICGWSLLEVPLELGLSDSYTRLLALLVSKLVVLGTGFAAIARVRFTRGIFSFICGASVLAVTPGLPLEFNQCFVIAVVSSIECIGKAACVMVFCIASSRERQLREQSGLQ
jgi:hypothetical protein